VEGMPVVFTSHELFKELGVSTCACVNGGGLRYGLCLCCSLSLGHGSFLV
jgi:hypothetical protein